ncbi:hypothetical protein LDL59_13650 [Kaistella anthropi]|nr:hypothetical protein [Kaistella anthropi]
MASSSMVSIHADSIQLDMEQKKFSFFGKQMITRKSAVITRKLITEGFFDDIIRSPNNPHGVMLKNWRIIDNEEISTKPKILIKDEKFSKTKRKKGIGMGGKKSEEVFHLFDGISLRVIYRIAGTGNFLPE